MSKQDLQAEIEKVKNQLLERGLIDYNESIFEEIVNNDISKVVSDYKLLKNSYKVFLNKVFESKIFGRIIVGNSLMKSFKNIKRKLIYLENYFIHNIGKEEFIQFCKGFSLVYGDINANKKLTINELDRFYYNYFKWTKLSDEVGDLTQDKEDILNKIVSLQKKLIKLENQETKKGLLEKVGFRVVLEKVKFGFKIMIIKNTIDNESQVLKEKIGKLNNNLDKENQRLEIVRNYINKLKLLSKDFDLYKINMDDKVLYKLLGNFKNINIVLNTNNSFAKIIENKFGIEFIQNSYEEQINTNTFKMLDNLIKKDKFDGRKPIEKIIAEVVC